MNSNRKFAFGEPRREKYAYSGLNHRLVWPKSLKKRSLMTSKIVLVMYICMYK